MKNIVHIFFNGGSVVLPKNNDWEKFGDIDALRTFLICAESWTRNGWEVRRLNTRDGDYFRTPFYESDLGQIDGRVEPQYKWYPAEYWQCIAKLRSIVVPGEYLMTATMDVINFGFRPEDFKPVDIDAAYYFQPEHFSMSAIAVTAEWLKTAEDILLAYDRGHLREIRGEYVSDERILREYHAATCYPVQKFACNPGDAPLIHFARSTLARIYNSIPLSHGS